MGKTLKKTSLTQSLNEKKCKILNPKNLNKCVQIASKSNYVLLGESTHGTREYYDLRLKMTKRLIHIHGFNTVFFETEWSIGYQLNLWIHNKIHRNLEDLLNELCNEYPKWMVNNEFIEKLLRFMKRWNKKQKRKVFFYGIDCQNVELAKENLCHDKTINCKIVQKIIENYPHMNKSNYWNKRDSFWFYVMELMKKQRQSKFVLWAHNSHIGDCKAGTNNQHKLNIGSLLNKAYKAFRIGFSTYEGSVFASDKWDKEGKQLKLKKASEKSFEHDFHFIAKRKKMKSFIYYCDPTIKSKKLFRYVGVVYDFKHEYQAHYSETNINKEYNVIIYIDKTNSIL